jgi:hypothetical protein
MTIHLQVGLVLLPFVITASLGATAQQVPVPTAQSRGGQIMPERDKNKEDEVARLFETTRAAAKLPSLKRIKHSSELEQHICTAALTGERTKVASAFYRTTTPQLTAPELETIAASNRLDRYHPGRSIYERYSVAVWRTKDSQTGSADYWVGVSLYGSAVGEFVDCHFTDDVYYCGKWKETVARSCRGKWLVRPAGTQLSLLQLR